MLSRGKEFPKEIEKANAIVVRERKSIKPYSGK
jgi:hypothetical protein